MIRKTLPILILITGLLISCSEKKESPENKKVTSAVAEVAPKTEKAKPAEDKLSPNVHEVKSVIPSKNKETMIDFTWMEDGEEVKFSEYTKGKAVFVNLWGTWCPPCRAEIPDLIKITSDLKEKEFVMIGLALERNPNNAIQAVNAFVNKSGINYKIFVDNSQQLVQNIMKSFGNIEGVPTTYIFDKKTKITSVITGMRSYEEFMAYINKVI
jgi:thiol-disulfide isomerase/thioredoxin